jgi:epoxyqueuosine reductase
MGVEEQIKQKALSLGFDLVGITSAEKIDERHIQNFRDWLNAGSNGQMQFLARNPANRFNLSDVLAGAKSVICTAINYKIQQPDSGDNLKIASYALYPDYHIFIKDRLALLADFLKSIDSNVKFKICVDSSPLAEKLFAMRAGLGFIGKNRLITNKKFGSFLLLGEIITDMPLNPDEAIEKQECGKCRKCIDACPTGAISEAGFDARKCISYLTIEHKGEIDAELKSKIGNHFFGCEECLSACPYNDKSPICEKKQFGFEAKDVKLTADEVLGWSEKDFDAFAKNSAMHRTGLERIKRNAGVCKSV